MKLMLEKLNQSHQKIAHTQQEATHHTVEVFAFGVDARGQPF